MSLVANEIHLLLRTVPWRFQVIVPTFTNGRIVSEAKSVKPWNIIRGVYAVFKILYSIQILLLVWHYKYGRINLSGGSTLYLIFRYGIGCLGCITYKFLLTSSKDLVAMINTLYLQPTLSSANQLRIFMQSTRYSIFLVGGIYICTIITTSYKPILVFSSSVSENNGVVLFVLDIFISLYDIWEYLVLVPLSTLVLCHGMFSSYAAIYVLVKRFNSTCNECYVQMLTSLNELLILVSLINASFQRFVSVGIKIEVMTICITCGAVLLNSTYRSKLSTTIVVLMFYFLLTLYFIMAFGYLLPGLANHVSSGMIVKMKVGIVTIRSNIDYKVARRRVAAVQPLRLRCGAVNYYEQGTSLCIINFLLEKTISLSLLRI